MQVDNLYPRECNIKTYSLNKPIHPRVIKTLMRISAPSPSRVVSDALQPKSGSLKEKKSASPLETENVSNEVAKKEVVLSLIGNSILGRRPTREFLG